jgi:hypothetical protein
MEAIGLRRATISADRGARQQHKILSLLAVAQPEGSTPLVEMLIEGGHHMGRGTVAIVVTPSLDRSWVAPLATMRGAGVSPIACIIEPLAHTSSSLLAVGQEAPEPSQREPMERGLRALQHALAEHDVGVHLVQPGIPLAEQLVAVRGAGVMVT